MASPESTYSFLEWISGAQKGILDPAGPIAAGERTILLNSLAIMLAIVIPTILLTLYFAWKYRASNTKAHYKPDWSYSGQLELLVWSIPALVVLFLGGICWIGSHELDPAQPLPSTSKPLEVEVISMDWKWLFIYPEQSIASINKLVIPAGKPVHFRLTSATVMNSFFVPQLGSQIYTMAGMATQLYLQADQPGQFAGLSAQFSGEGFSDMHFIVDALPESGFNQWAQHTRKSKTILNTAQYTTLAKTSNVAPLQTFSNVTPGLFDTVVSMDMVSQGNLSSACGTGTAALSSRNTQGS